MIYLDSAATTIKKPDEVIEAVIAAMRSCGNSNRSLHRAAENAGRLIYEARKTVAAFFHCPDSSNVIFTSGATESLNTVLRGLPFLRDFTGSCDTKKYYAMVSNKRFIPPETPEIIITDWSHNSVLRPLYELSSKEAINLKIARSDRPTGKCAPENITKLLTPKTRAMVLTLASNVTGNICEIAKLSAQVKSYNPEILIICDAAQAAGEFPLDMSKLGIDILCFTGHKALLGPQGTGGICFLKDFGIRPLKSGGTGILSMLKTQPPTLPERLEAGTLNAHGIAGLKAALDFITAFTQNKIIQHNLYLTYKFYQEAKQMPRIKVYGDFAGIDRIAEEIISAEANSQERQTAAVTTKIKESAAGASSWRAPIVSLTVDNLESALACDLLAEKYQIAVRGGLTCAPLMHEALGTLKTGTLRFSFGLENTADDVEAASAALCGIATK